MMADPVHVNTDDSTGLSNLAGSLEDIEARSTSQVNHDLSLDFDHSQTWLENNGGCIPR